MVLFLLHLAGAAALLIWSIRLIRTGIERGFMPQLRLILRRSESSRPLAALAGTAAATLMQSSTAVALVVAGFTVSGGLAAAAGLAIMLGADLGSAIASQILLLRADWLPPLLLLVGATLFLRFSQRSVRQSGRALVGLGMVFL
ncbi:MAG: Na/Pi cotransporter family protein, partial [Alphaproteobacteria bacterium]